ncbi:MAG: GyrI-like domain-containing protein [Candidatus Kerfeldbacteria bacterium]|nr:GyrI-like domain-containing protein [Candidatus Kerfeldbacteria bacterium]
MRAFVPEITEEPRRSILTVTAVGSPRTVFKRVLPLLYGTAYGTKFKVFKPRGKKMDIGRLACAYPDGLRKPMTKWTIVSDLEVPAFVKAKDLLQKDPARPVALLQRKKTTVAQILHVGSYAKEQPTIRKLHAFIKKQKLRVVGPHEEVYLTRPGPKAKTIIRYAVQKR